jgi:uncharacterized integral membrane protein
MKKVTALIISMIILLLIVIFIIQNAEVAPVEMLLGILRPHCH